MGRLGRIIQHVTNAVPPAEMPDDILTLLAGASGEPKIVIDKIKEACGDKARGFLLKATRELAQKARAHGLRTSTEAGPVGTESDEEENQITPYGLPLENFHEAA
jgi:hypothetical protein